VVIPTPEIKAFKIAPNYDFILLGSDGIFDKVSNKEIIHNAWQSIHAMSKPNVHQVSGRIVETVVSLALRKRSLDNVTVVAIALSNLKRKVKNATPVVINV
jgi:protein phosphatase 2C family protein 2/3